MRYALFFAIFILFIGCGGNDSSQTPPSSTYSLSFNTDSTEITGEVSFDIGNIPKNHIVTLKNFTPVIEGCSVDFTDTAIDPDSLTFTAISTKQSASVKIKLSSVCSATTLQLKADYVDSSLLNGKPFVNTTEKTYTFTVEKTSTASNYTPVVRNSTVEITKNKQNEEIVVAVYDQLNRPAVDGNISIIYPDIITNSVDIGSFDKSTVDVENGEAHFSYTAPNDLQTLTENNITTTSFKFYYNDDIANYAELSLRFNPDTNQTVIKEYNILFSPQDGTYKMSLEQSKSFSVLLRDEDGNAVDESDIEDINISLENSYIAKLVNSSGEENTSFHFTNKNNITMTLQSKTVSGLVPIHVDTKFKDINGEEKTLNETYNIIVESGPPTSISISYADTTQDKEHAKFIEHFVVSVTDKYFNPVNTNPQVSVGAIVGYAKYEDDGLYANTDKRIYVDSAPFATLTQNTLELNRDYIEANTTIDLANDILVTFGNGYTYPASGAWSFDEFNSSAITLSAGQYDGNETTNLGFAIGRNHRQDACNFGDEWIGQAKLQNNSATIDENGSAVIDFTYDYYLVGKDILLYVNIIGKDNKLDKTIKIGEVKKHTLRGLGIEIGDDRTVTAENGATVTKRFYAWISQTDLPYRNARFVFQNVTQTGNGHIVAGYPIQMPIDSCSSNGHAYVEYTIQADANETFSVTVDKPLIVNEF